MRDNRPRFKETRRTQVLLLVQTRAYKLLNLDHEKNLETPTHLWQPPTTPPCCAGNRLKGKLSTKLIINSSALTHNC